MESRCRFKAETFRALHPVNPGGAIKQRAQFPGQRNGSLFTSGSGRWLMARRTGVLT